MILQKGWKTTETNRTIKFHSENKHAFGYQICLGGFDATQETVTKDVGHDKGDKLETREDELVYHNVDLNTEN